MESFVGHHIHVGMDGKDRLIDKLGDQLYLTQNSQPEGQGKVGV